MIKIISILLIDGAHMRGMYISCCSRGVISTSKPISIAWIVTANAFLSDEKDPELACSSDHGRWW